MGETHTHSCFLMTFFVLWISIQGWNSWNHFGCNVDEKLIKSVADAIISTGLAAAGYEYGYFVFYLKVN